MHGVRLVIKSISTRFHRGDKGSDTNGQTQNEHPRESKP